MIGYWANALPVKTGNKSLLTTVYAKKGKALIAIANLGRETAAARLEIDWKALGMDVRKASLRAVSVEGLQEARDLQWSSEITSILRRDGCWCWRKSKPYGRYERANRHR